MPFLLPYTLLSRAKSAITQEEGLVISSLAWEQKKGPYQSYNTIVYPVYNSERLWDLRSLKQF